MVLPNLILKPKEHHLLCLFYLYVQGSVTTYFYVHTVCAFDYRGRRVSDPLEMELWEIINHMMWVPEVNAGPLEEQ